MLEQLMAVRLCRIDANFVECSGGEVARTFHGRPMHIGHAKAAIF